MTAQLSRPPVALSSFEKCREHRRWLRLIRNVLISALRGNVPAAIGPSRGPAGAWALRGQCALAGQRWLANPATSGPGSRSSGWVWAGQWAQWPPSSAWKVGVGGRVGGELEQGQPPTLLFVLCVIIKAVHAYCKIWTLQKGRKERKLSVIPLPGDNCAAILLYFSPVLFSIRIIHMYICVYCNCNHTTVILPHIALYREHFLTAFKFSLKLFNGYIIFY